MRDKIWLLLLLAIELVTLSSQLQIELENFPKFRSYSPFFVTVNVSGAQEITKGHFEFISSKGKFATPEQVITPGKKTLQVLFPPLLETSNSQSIKIVFKTKTAKFDLGPHRIKRQSYVKERQFLIASNQNKKSPTLGFIENKLPIELYSSMPITDNGATQIVFRDKFHGSPIEYCAYNIVVIHGEYFSTLGEKQLEALLHWVEMGGSLFISILTNTSYLPYQQKFLNALTSGQNSGSMDAFTFYRREWGRAVVYHKKAFTKIAVTKAVQYRLVAFLWKFSYWQTAYFLSNKKTKTKSWIDTSLLDENTSPYDYNIDKSQANRYPNTYSVFPLRQEKGYIDYAQLPMENTRLILEWLLPKTIKILPTWLLVFILLIFLVIVGPVDYFILGKLNKRVLTWVLFPVVTLVFWILSVYLAELYLGNSSVQNYIEIVDLGSKNQVLKSNRFYVFFKDKPQQLPIQCNNSLYSVIKQSPQHRTMNLLTSSSTSSSNFLHIAGTYPLEFTAHHSIQQWKPIWTRQFSSFKDREKFAVNINFDALKNILPILTPLHINRWWSEYKGYEYVEDVYKRTRKKPFVLNPNFKIGQADKVFQFDKEFKGDIYVLHQYQMYIFKYQRGVTPLPFIVEASRRQQLNLFSLVSQISPNGANHLEDLSILDPLNPKEWLVIFVTKKNKNFHVYRRLLYDQEMQ